MFGELSQAGILPGPITHRREDLDRVGRPIAPKETVPKEVMQRVAQCSFDPRPLEGLKCGLPTGNVPVEPGQGKLKHEFVVDFTAVIGRSRRLGQVPEDIFLDH